MPTLRYIKGFGDSLMLISVPFNLGEQEAITLAEKIGANLIILDERDARQMAWQRGLNVIGLLGVLGMVFPKWDVPYCLLPIAYCLITPLLC